MSELWTPQTHDVRGSYVNSFGEYSDVAEGWFDRWYTETIRAARAEGWDEGYDAGEECALTAEQDDHECVPNPYENGAGQ